MCYVVKEIRKGVWHIDESGLDAMYVIKGSRCSAVIDTGTGIGDFQKLVESLVEPPYQVIITHGHVDHAGGCGQFAEAYIQEKDYEAAMAITLEEREGYLQNMERAGAILPGSIQIEECMRNNRKPKFHFLKEGDVIDLGDKQLEVCEMPGHTAGSICLLDRADRLLFSGDSVNDTELICAPAEDREALLRTWYETGEKLFSDPEAFDLCCGGHCLIPVERAKDTLACGEKILAGELEATVQSIHFFHGPFYRYKDIVLYNGSFEGLRGKKE